MAVFLPWVPLLLVAKLIGGIGSGLLLTGLIVMTTELVVPDRWGNVLSVVNISASMGTTTVTMVSYLLQHQFPVSRTFKYTWAATAAPAVMMLMVSVFLPEGPRWLSLKGRRPEAARTLALLKALDQDHFSQTSLSFLHLFGKDMLFVTLTGIAVQALVTTTSAPTLILFLHPLGVACGVHTPCLPHVVVAAHLIMVVFCAVPIVFLDGCRRKDALVFGMVGTALAYLALAIVQAVSQKPGRVSVAYSTIMWRVTDQRASASLALIMFVLSLATATTTSVSWLYITELFPVHARTKGVAVSLAAGHLVSGAAALILPFSFEYWRCYTFFPLAFLALVGGLVVTSFPETKIRVAPALYIESTCPPTPVPQVSVHSTIMSQSTKTQFDPLSSDTMDEVLDSYTVPPDTFTSEAKSFGVPTTLTSANTAREAFSGSAAGSAAGSLFSFDSASPRPLKFDSLRVALRLSDFSY